MDLALIDTFEQGGPKIVAALAGLSQADLIAVPIPGKWSIQTLIIHLMDAEMVFANRMKRVIAEDNPTLQGYDETKWVAGLHYEQQSTHDASQIIALIRRQMARLLRQLPDAALDRAGQHTERGRITLRDLINYDNQHVDHHLKFLYEKRAKLGK